MALLILQPTANETPDSGQGGLDVTTPTNTGHASTVTTASEGAVQSRSCRWFSFSDTSAQRLSVTLKIDHTTSGSLVGAGATNTFTLEYSLNNGGSWTLATSRANFTTSQGPTTFSVGLSVGQNISQVQVRVFYQAATGDVGESASVTATIANIKLEVVTVDPQVIVMM